MEVKCENCGKTFQKKIAEIKRTKSHYCSKPCTGKGKQKKTARIFFSRCEKVSNGCLEWKGATNKHGYGVQRHQGKIQLAHRVSYQLSKGEIPDGMHVMHSCDNPICINPDHLSIGTHMDNMQDMWVKERGRSILTRAEVAEIRASSESSYALADKYKVSSRAIRYARDTSNWLPLPQPPIGE